MTLNRLEHEGPLDEAERLILELVDATEREARATATAVEPTWYLRLARIYRRQGRHLDEVAVLGRLERQNHVRNRTAAALLERLEKLRRTYDDITSARSGAQRDRSPIGNADEFLSALRSAKHYGGLPVVNEGAPARSRSAGSSEDAVSLQVVASAQALISEARSDSGALGQELKWLRETRPELAYARALISVARSDPGAVARELERLCEAHPELCKRVAPWARDAWLLAGDIPGALASLPEPMPYKVTALDMDLRLTMKHVLGLKVNARELFALYPPKVTSAVRNHEDLVIEIAQDRLEAEQSAGADPLRDLFLDPRLETSGWPLWNASTQVVPTVGAPFGRLSQLVSGGQLVASLQRAAENALREDLGLPHVGQGWVAETRLFVELQQALDTEVVQHGVPEGFGRQHLDVWIPDWNIGVEYQGEQHFSPVEFFGGEAAFAKTVERDRQKRSKARKLGIALISVEAGYDLNEVLMQIEASRTRSNEGAPRVDSGTK